MIPNTLRLWIDAVKRMEANPGTPTTCPLCDGGALVVEDIRSEADPDVGTRIIRCTHCGHHSTSRYHFGPRVAASDIAAE